MPSSSFSRIAGRAKEPAPMPWDAPAPGVPEDEKRAWRGTVLSFLFLFSTIVALALVPAFLNRSVIEDQTQIRDVLDPAERFAAEIELAQTKRLAALEAFLISGDPRFRQQYRESQREEERALENLVPLIENFDVDEETETRAWELAVRVRDLSFSWHLVVQEVLNEEVDRGTLHRNWDEERGRADDLFSVTRALRGSLSAETALRLGDIGAKQDLQALISRFLIVFGLLAPLAILISFLWKLRSWMRESESLRWAAVRARRGADALLAATGDGVLGMDQTGKCRFLNRAGADLLGYPMRLVVGRDVHELLHHSRPDGTPLPRDDCEVLRAVETGIPLTGRNEVLWGAGQVFFPVQVSVRPLKDGKEILGAVLTFTDMTATREAEANLRQALQARDEVLAVVSHDLRNPVGTIFSAASLLLELELSEAKRREQLTSVKRAAGRMNRLIQDLLDVARMEAGALRVASSQFQLQELLDEIVLIHRDRARQQGVRIYSRFPDPYAQGWGDRDRIHQVLSNLVDNALKFSDEGGVVEIGAREEPEEGGVQFWVSDNGPGIEANDQTRLFDRFWQVSRRDKRGAGLGLSIVKGLVEAHGGRVWVESEVEKGSTFLFLLPERSSEGKDGPGASPNRETGASLGV